MMDAMHQEMESDTDAVVGKVARPSSVAIAAKTWS
jgi:hypothetical protein